MARQDAAVHMQEPLSGILAALMWERHTGIQG
jgi:hypothetical protein